MKSNNIISTSVQYKSSCWNPFSWASKFIKNNLNNEKAQGNSVKPYAYTKYSPSIFTVIGKIIELSAREGMKPTVQVNTDNSLRVIVECNEQAIRSHIDQGGSPNACVDLYNNTLLHFAIRQVNSDLVKLLLTKGANVNSKNKGGFSPLNFAASNIGMSDHVFLIIKLLLENKPNADCFINGKNSLHFAALLGGSKAIKALIEGNACDINILTEDNKQAALHLAARKGHIEVVQCLIKLGANINLVDNAGNTPLHLALEGNHIEVAKLLIDNKADVDLANNAGNRPLHLALEGNHIEVAKLLIDNKADVDLANNAGNRPLHLAAQKGYLEVVRCLIDNKADVDLADNARCTPLHFAARKGYLEVVKCLIDNKADVNLADNARCTPLHFAVERNHIEVVKLLLQSSADTSIRSIWCDLPIERCSVPDPSPQNIKKWESLFNNYSSPHSNDEQPQLVVGGDDTTADE